MVEGWQAVISADVIESLFAMAFGFTFAGLIVQHLHLFWRRRFLHLLCSVVLNTLVTR